MIQKNKPLLVIIGPSGVGKSTIVSQLNKDGLVSVIPTWTDRPPRSDETLHSLEHRFVSTEEFSRLANNSFFLETISLFNLPYRYGFTTNGYESTDKTPLLMLRARLIPLVKKYFINYKVYQIERALNDVEAKLKDRENSGIDNGSRLLDYEEELSKGRKYADRVFINNKAKDTAAKIRIALKEDF